jgi:ribosomal protein L11 methylase PrmA
MESGFYDEVTRTRLLIPHEEVDPAGLPGVHAAYRVLKPEPVNFVSYPYEWCFSQLKDAALLTLELQKRALEFDLSLKDASAYNVLFHEGRPVFVDTLSFERYTEGRPWVAYQQFCRHFLAPLALLAYRHADLGRLSRLYIDGIPLDVASALLPFRTILRPRLAMHLHLHSRMQQRHANDSERGKPLRVGHVSRAGLQGLIASLEAAVRAIEWKPGRTEWANYYTETNYNDTALDHKTALVRSFLSKVVPRSVWDLGANTGVFSRLASDLGIYTLAFDLDPAAVEANYRRVQKNAETKLLPLVMDLTNPSPGLGWHESERDGLRNRGPADLVMALALVHHLAIGNNVPLERVAAFFHELGRFLLIEFVPKSDSQVKRLLFSREDIFPEYTQQGFELAFSSLFVLRQRERIKNSERLMYLFEQK